MEKRCSLNPIYASKCSNNSSSLIKFPTVSTIPVELLLLLSHLFIKEEAKTIALGYTRGWLESRKKICISLTSVFFDLDHSYVGSASFILGKEITFTLSMKWEIEQKETSMHSSELISLFKVFPSQINLRLEKKNTTR